MQETEEGNRRADQAAQLAQTAGGAIGTMADALRESAEAAKEIATHARQRPPGSSR